MNIIICLDERCGVLFNHRRQSKDRTVIADIAEHLTGKLYVAPYSEKLFANSSVPYCVSENLLHEADDGDVCFVEDTAFVSCLPRVNQITVYWWNRHYPADVTLTLDWESAGFHSASKQDFVGFSHEKITKEIFVR